MGQGYLGITAHGMNILSEDIMMLQPSKVRRTICLLWERLGEDFLRLHCDLFPGSMLY